MASSSFSRDDSYVFLLQSLSLAAITEESANSVKSAKEDRQNLHKAPKDVLVTPLQVLRRWLSPQSTLSNTLASAERLQDLAAAKSDPGVLRIIGVGTFGVVFEVLGTTLAVKKTLNGPAAAHILVNEFGFGTELQQAFYFKAIGIYKQHPELKNFVVPRVPCYTNCFGTIRADGKHPWWQQNGIKFPSGHGYDKAGPVFYFEKVMPLPKEIRTNLIKHFFPPELVETALKDPNNKDALIRPYLGHSWADLTEEQRKTGRTSLRNFPLYVDELDLLGLEPTIIASDIALAVATAHWCTGIDLLDSEFVLGSRPSYSKDLQTFLDASTHIPATNNGVTDTTPTEDPLESGATHNRAVQLWLIDFDKCARFTIEHDTAVADIEDLVRRTRANDPYYPCSIAASRLEAAVWAAFRDAYIAASRALLSADLDGFVKTGALLGGGVEVLAEERRDALLDRPRQIMIEWARQDRAAMDTEEFERRKEIAVREGRYRGKK